MDKLLLIFTLIINNALALDKNQYSNAPLKAWFDKLLSSKGLCCSFADGLTLTDPEWGIHEDHYWVIIEGNRYRVPDNAIVNIKNIYKKAVVWPYKDSSGEWQIRCFMAGTLS